MMFLFGALFGGTIGFLIAAVVNVSERDNNNDSC